LGRTEISSIYGHGEAHAELFAQLGFEQLSTEQAPEELWERAEVDPPLLVRRFERGAPER
ncbi:MAG: hypothetical protein M3252_04440, partial [Actinomycetota bacterium]|nr:hypothetical protein [Actinomycetota bacterium]